MEDAFKQLCQARAMACYRQDAGNQGMPDPKLHAILVARVARPDVVDAVVWRMDVRARVDRADEMEC